MCIPVPRIIVSHVQRAVLPLLGEEGRREGREKLQRVSVLSLTSGALRDDWKPLGTSVGKVMSESGSRVWQSSSVGQPLAGMWSGKMGCSSAFLSPPVVDCQLSLRSV